VAAFRYQGIVINAVGYAIAGAQVYVCTQPASTGSIPPSPLASIFTDAGGLIPLANPVTVDGNGNFFFYANPGVYTLVFFDPFNRIPTQVFPDLEVVSPGGGTVTSVALVVPTEFSVSGSPIIGAGTFTVTKTNQNANAVAAGPASGGAAPWAFRPLVTADLPAGVGTVTSVAVSLTGGALFTLSSTGGPITTSGTIALVVNFANQAANLFLAGPSSGGSGPVTARAIAPADLPGLLPVAFSATPVFNAGASGSFSMTLTGNVSSSSITNATSGQTITFIITQDGTGGRTFPWPSNVKGASGVAGDANSVSVQSFIYDGAFWRATSPGVATLT
jgi:hypothetical protein